jgi:uncharacterized membrane protein YhdT
MTARLREAIGICVAISALSLLRLSMKEAALFGLTLFLIYLPGYLVNQYLSSQKQGAIETHITSLAFGMSTIIITSFATMQINIVPSFITSTVIEGTIIFVIGNIILFRNLLRE